MWFHDNQPIKDDDIYRIIAGEEGEVTLELPEVFPEDAGVYTVKAVNEHGEVSGEAVLTVLTGKMFELAKKLCSPCVYDINGQIAPIFFFSAPQPKAIIL